MAHRIKSLLQINKEAESVISVLHSKIHGLQTRIGILNGTIKNNASTFENGAKSVRLMELLVDDLKAENRTLRTALRGFAMTNHHRIDDPLSYGHDSVRDATTALVADSAPTASKAKDEEDG